MSNTLTQYLTCPVCLLGQLQSEYTPGTEYDSMIVPTHNDERSRNRAPHHATTCKASGLTLASAYALVHDPFAKAAPKTTPAPVTCPICNTTGLIPWLAPSNGALVLPIHVHPHLSPSHCIGSGKWLGLSATEMMRQNAGALHADKRETLHEIPHAGGIALSSSQPRWDLLSRNALLRLIKRCELGIERKTVCKHCGVQKIAADKHVQKTCHKNPVDYPLNEHIMGVQSLERS